MAGVIEVEQYPMPDDLREVAGMVNTCRECHENPAETVIVELPERAVQFWCAACLVTGVDAGRIRLVLPRAV